jgi:hypothetical protein
MILTNQKDWAGRVLFASRLPTTRAEDDETAVNQGPAGALAETADQY